MKKLKYQYLFSIINHAAVKLNGIALTYKNKNDSFIMYYITFRVCV